MPSALGTAADLRGALRRALSDFSHPRFGPCLIEVLTYSGVNLSARMVISVDVMELFELDAIDRNNCGPWGRTVQ